MTKFGIIAAFRGELRPLVEKWQRLDLGAGRGGQAAWRGRIGTAECIAVPGGMGKDAAARACDIAESALGGLDGLVSLGWAGALSCGVHPARAYPVEEVVDASTGERFVSSLSPSTGSQSGGPRLRLLTLDHVARAGEKRPLAEKHQAVLVDMEAATVARMAKQKGIVFYCFKAVSDAYGEILPDFSRYGDAEGQLRMPALLGHTAFRPKYWPAMARMGKNAQTGAVVLAAALRDFLEKHADKS
jgi:adenosylhomocysteine nucleosidase